MDFFDRQEAARKQTFRLLFYFGFAVAGTIGGLYLGALVFVVFAQLKSTRSHLYFHLWEPRLFLWVALVTLLVVAIGAIYKISVLARGGNAVADALDGRPIPPNTLLPRERQLLNVVEEMAIASGVPAPAVYVIPGSDQINALAAGHSPRDAVLCVTEGALRHLDRDEMQGAIAHEFSHILNGDMRLNLRLMGVVFGILCIAHLGQKCFEIESNSDFERRGNVQLYLFGFILCVVGYSGAFFARAIKGAVNRQREFLADAAAVQFTRNPAGLAGALRKASLKGSFVRGAEAEEAAHLFFLSGLPESTLDFFPIATHPPVALRLHHLDPEGRGFAPPAPKEETPASAVAVATLPVRVGTVTPAHLDYASALRKSLPRELILAAREPFSAPALVLALLFAEEGAARAAQEMRLDADPLLKAEVLRLRAFTAPLGSRARLPLLSLSLSALRFLSVSQYGQFIRMVGAFIEADGQVELFEFALQKALRARLDPHFGCVAARPETVYRELGPLLPDCSLLLSALAYAGQGEAWGIGQAFAAGAARLGVGFDAVRLLDASAYDLAKIDAALDRLDRAAPPLKRRILEACAAVVAADGQVLEWEAELLRAIADALDCPVPPFLEEAV